MSFLHHQVCQVPLCILTFSSPHLVPCRLHPVSYCSDSFHCSLCVFLSFCLWHSTPTSVVWVSSPCLSWLRWSLWFLRIFAFQFLFPVFWSFFFIRAGFRCPPFLVFFWGFF